MMKVDRFRKQSWAGLEKTGGAVDMRIRNKSRFEKICRKAILTDFYYYVRDNNPTVDEAAEYYGVSRSYISRIAAEMKPLIKRFKNKLWAREISSQELDKVISSIAEKPLYEAGRSKQE